MNALNGSTNGASAYEADLDLLYSWMPGSAPAPQPCPEALFSCTIKGFISGHETLLTVRAMSRAEFQRNLQSITGMLDPVPTPAATQGQPQSPVPACPQHGILRRGKRGFFCPVKMPDGSWCPSKAR